jgi:hypothetical protein
MTHLGVVWYGSWVSSRSYFCAPSAGQKALAPTKEPCDLRSHTPGTTKKSSPHQLLVRCAWAHGVFGRGCPCHLLCAWARSNVGLGRSRGGVALAFAATGACTTLAVCARSPPVSCTCSGYSGELPLVARSSETWGRGTGGHGSKERIRQAQAGLRALPHGDKVERE